MKKFTKQFGIGWRGARWQQYFIAAFLPLSVAISLLTRYDYSSAPDARTLSMLIFAALVSLLWAGAKEGSKSPLAVPTLITLSILALIVLLCKITFAPRPTVTVAVRFGEGAVRIVAERVSVECNDPAQMPKNPLANYNFIRFA